MEARDVAFFTKNYRNVKHLYRSAFPKDEQFPFFLLELSTLDKNTRLLAFYEDEEFLGLCHFTSCQTTLFVIFLAVDESARGKGVGSKILQFLKGEYPDKTLCLGIEPLDETAENYAQRVSRLHFYERNGFLKTDLLLTDPTGQYTILSTAKDLDEAALAKILKKASFGPYQCYFEHLDPRG